MKVELMAEHLRHINPAASVRSLPSSVVLDDAAAALLDRDVIFLCTDEHWGRSIVNQIAYQYLIPVINLGMRIAAEGGSITAAAGVVDMLRPDVPVPLVQAGPASGAERRGEHAGGGPRGSHW